MNQSPPNFLMNFWFTKISKSYYPKTYYFCQKEKRIKHESIKNTSPKPRDRAESP